MYLPQLATKRPVATIMIFLTISLLGFISMRRLSVDLLPDISYPVIAVRTTFPNSAPEEVENMLTRPIEEAVSAIPGIRQLTSSSSEGLSMVTIEFAWGSDMDYALLHVREKLDRLRHLLPADAGRATIISLDPSSEPIIVLAVSGRDLYLTRQFAQDVVKRRLEQIDGVAMVAVTGGAEREIRVEVDDQALDALNIGMEQIARALELSNYSFPGGTVCQGQHRYSLRTLGEFTSLRDIESVIILHANGSQITLGQIAAVKDGEKERSGVNRLNGIEAVGLQIFKGAGANTVAVARDVDAAIGQIQAEYADIMMTEIHNQAHFISLAIDNVVQAIVSGSILAIFVLLIFLRGIRLPLVIGVSIPVSLLATFVLFLRFDVHFNIMSLGGLALGIGLLVDNSIIVLENIFRLQGNDPLDGAVASQGAAEVTAPLCASTLTTIAAFLPIVFIRGIAGQLFRDQAFAVTCSLLASLPTALTLIPVLASCRSKGRRPQRACFHLLQRAKKLSHPFHSTLRVYENLLNRALARPARWLLCVGIIFLSTIIAFQALQRELMPRVASQEMMINLTLARGTQMERLIAASEQLETMLLADSTVVSVFAQLARARYGIEMASDIKMESARFRVRCREKSDPHQTFARIERQWRRPPGAELMYSQVESSIGRLFHVSDGDLCISVTGPDLKTLQTLLCTVRNHADSVKGISEVWTTASEGAPEIRIRIDRQEAARFGITAHHIAHAIHNTVQGLTATQFNEFDQQTDIVVRAASSSRATWNDLLNIHIAVDSLLFPLRSLVDFDIGRGPSKIDRHNQVRCLEIYANIKGRPLQQVIADLQHRCSKMAMPPGYEIRYGGVNEAMKQSFRELAFALILAVILIYMILAAQFESIRHPLLIILSVPMALIGAVWALLITGTSLNILSFIGMVALAGIAVNDAIIKVSFIQQRRQEGLDLKSALIDAGRMRVRPIIMTSATTIFGLLPLALSVGPGSLMAKPLAIAIIGGLLSSTILTLLVIPILYYIMEK
ncbi:efflux RND transporter permease subunit [candidate division KSB1 bacterium]|nr:efflux RND transporter permease subunit [candidate division KSB1 bacterium]